MEAHLSENNHLHTKDWSGRCGDSYGISESGEIPQETKRRGSSPLAPWKAKQSVAEIPTHRLTKYPYKKRDEWRHIR
ncbi:hypothetical protein [Priestia koreensis]|uniref:hypothetical protein n=1 Tax=Priestia koreensis TaxID=284581 RepID=UPI000AE91DCC|nr:hypothetical protein [Priestia koreensis]